MNTTTDHNITLTSNAAKRIKQIVTEGQEKGKFLRISVEGGGCFGLQYKYDFAETKTDQDVVISKDGAQVVIDDISISFMTDSTIDYVETLGFASFEITNPNSKSSCGCGNSFSI